MFYFETLLNEGLAGIDRTAMLGTITGIAYAILLIGFLIGLYQAAMSGGDLRSLAVTAIKYVVVAIIVANWSTVFREVNSSISQVAHGIYSSSTAGDVFLNWLDQLKQQFDGDGTTSFLQLVSNSGSALITVVLVFVAYLIYVLAIVVFGFFFTLFGCLLYVLGPLVLALLPMPGAGSLAKSFAANIFIWNGWAILYATFASLITAIQANRVNDLGFLGFFRGGLDSTTLGLVSIFYALAILLIPFIAKKIVSGDVGATASSLVRSAVVAAGAALSAGAGFATGFGTGSTTASSGGAASGGAAATSSTAATSSAAPPPAPEPSLAGTIRSGIASALNGDPPRPQPAGEGGGNSGSGKSEEKKDGSGGGSQAPSLSQSGVGTFRPIGMAQALAYQAGRALGSTARQAVRATSKQDSENGNGKES